VPGGTARANYGARPGEVITLRRGKAASTPSISARFKRRVWQKVDRADARVARARNRGPCIFTIEKQALQLIRLHTDEVSTVSIRRGAAGGFDNVLCGDLGQRRSTEVRTSGVGRRHGRLRATRIRSFTARLGTRSRGVSYGPSPWADSVITQHTANSNQLYAWGPAVSRAAETFVHGGIRYEFQRRPTGPRR